MQNKQITNQNDVTHDTKDSQPNLTAKIVAVVLILLQITLLSFVIWNSLTIIETNQEVRLRCGLFDPYDYMKGRYIRLNFLDINSVDKDKMPGLKSIYSSDLQKVKKRPVYCILKQVEDYHIIKDISFEKPEQGILFITLNIKYLDEYEITLKPHFDNYYLQEDFAVKADRLLQRSRTEPLDFKLVLAVGKSGKVIQKDFLVNNTPVIDYIQQNPN